MIGKKIFLIDDEFDIREFLQFNLVKEGFQVYTFENPVEALPKLKQLNPDLIVTDWLMPELDGLQLCKILKRNNETSHIPIIMITCKGDEIDVVTALEIGADDYLVKPFGIKELAVRIKKILGKQMLLFKSELNVQTQIDNCIRVKGLVINKEMYTAHLDNEKLNLTYAEFKLLELLAKKPGKVFTRSQIIEHDCGGEYYVTERSVDVKIVGLRKKLGKHEKMIETIRSVGYRFNETI